MRTSRLGVPRPGTGLLVTALVAGALFWMAYDNGSYGLESRATIAIAAWWAVFVAVVFGLRSREPVSRASIAIGFLLAALALWTLASILWSPSAEKTFDELNRLGLYLGVFVLVTVGATRASLGRWADGLALAISAVAGVALTSRLFPGVFPEGDLPTFLPGAVTRLSFPLGYWNGLAIFVALGVPLLLRIALLARSSLVRGIALAPIPAIGASIYLASSRGGFVTFVVGSVVFFALTERRWAAGVALALSVLGAAAAIAVLLDRGELVDGPLGTDLAERQGRNAALLITLICAGTSLVYGLGSRALAGRVRPSPVLGWIAVLAIAAVAAVGIVSADPVERFEAFKAPPGQLDEIDRGDFVKSHLLSAAGSGRWQFWGAAVEQWQEHPLTGEGAGSYEAWWAENGTTSLFAKDAHSLYLEALGELGVIGLGLVLAIAVAGVGVGVQRARRAEGALRVSAAALTAVFASFAGAAAFDWVWELTVAGAVGVTVLALVAGSGAALPAPLQAVAMSADGRGGGRFVLGLAALLVAWGVIVAQAIPLLAQREITASQEAADRGDLRDAFDAARAARDIQPWAATPYLQLALVSEEARTLRLGRSWIEEAIARDDRDWRLWLVAARLETKLGRVDAAERSLRRAVELNPRSPLFAGLAERKR